MAQPPNPSEADASGREDRHREDLHRWMVAYGPALRAYFRKKVGAAEAEDLVQEVFLAMQARGALADTAHVNRYLFRVAANAVAKRHQPGAWDWSEHAELDDLELADELSPERTLIAKQTLARLLIALKEAPPRAAEAFTLHRFDEMTYGEIAEHMGITVKAVEGHIKRALERITLLLEAPR